MRNWRNLLLVCILLLTGCALIKQAGRTLKAIEVAAYASTNVTHSIGSYVNDMNQRREETHNAALAFWNEIKPTLIQGATVLLGGGWLLREIHHRRKTKEKRK